MISVEDALAQVLSLVRPLGGTRVPLREAAGRVLSEPCIATRDQPPFAASAMDGYAVADPAPNAGTSFRVIGESAAGHGFGGTLQGADAVRIFTGAPVPKGGVRVLIQEDVTRDGDRITLNTRADAGPHIRPPALDFARGTRFDPRRRLTPADVALLAAMGLKTAPVRRKPEIALIATGDELVMPGEAPGPDQIVASNSFGLAAMIENAGAVARLLPIARDTRGSLATAFELAAGADVIVTIGGASVGDHDLVADVAAARGMERAFYKVAMRPGKPLMAGRLAGTAMIGLPGNPVSSMVCGTIFILPMIRRMLGLPPDLPTLARPLAAPLPANGARRHYMRATDDARGVTAFDSQDSARLGLLAAADCLLVRAPHDPARQTGHLVDVIPL